MEQPLSSPATSSLSSSSSSSSSQPAQPHVTAMINMSGAQISESRLSFIVQPLAETKKEFFPKLALFPVPPPVEIFVGRETLISELRKHFEKPELQPVVPQKTATPEGKKEAKTKIEASSPALPISGSASTTSPTVVLCTGLGGVGKTQIALAYAKQTQKQYTRQLWFNAQDKNALMTAYRQLAQAEGLLPDPSVDDTIVQAIIQRWFAQQNSLLIIYDAAEGHETLKPYLPKTKNVHTLITTCLAQEHWPPTFVAPKIDLLSEEAACTLLEKLMRREDPDIPKLAEILGYLPLALAQAGAYLCQNRAISVKRYLELYKKNADVYLKKPTLPRTESVTHVPVFVTWDLSLKAIAEEESKGEHTPSRPLLETCAFLSPQQIPLSLPQCWFDKTYPKSIEPFEESLGRLGAYSLIQLNAQNSSLTIHRLVQEVMREQLSSERQKERINEILKFLQENYYEMQEEDDAARPADYSWAPHIETVIDHHKKKNLPKNMHLAIIISHLGSSYSHLGEHKKEHILAEEALATLEGCEDPHYEIVKLYFSLNLGNAYLNLGDPEKALPILKKTYETMIAHYGPNDLRITPGLTSLSDAYAKLQDPFQQKQLLKQKLAILKKHYRSDHFQIGLTLNKLSVAYRELGDLRESLSASKEALSILKKHYGPNRLQLPIASCLNNMANTYGCLKKYFMQRQLLQESLSIKKNFFGKDHSDVATTLSDLGIAYRHLGELSESRDLLETEALPILIKYYGVKNLEVAKAYMNLGDTYEAMGNEKKASFFSKAGLNSVEQLYGLYHPKILNFLEHHARRLSLKGNAQEACALLRRALRIRKKNRGGKADLQIIECEIFLSFAYVRCGNIELARKRLRHVETLSASDSTYENYLKSNRTLKTLLITLKTFFDMKVSDTLKSKKSENKNMGITPSDDPYINLGRELRNLANNNKTAEALKQRLTKISQIHPNKYLSIINSGGKPINNTPLHYAALKGNFDKIKVLLDAGANPNQANDQGEKFFQLIKSFDGCPVDLYDRIAPRAPLLSSIEEIKNAPQTPLPITDPSSHLSSSSSNTSSLSTPTPSTTIPAAFFGSNSSLSSSSSSGSPLTSSSSVSLFSSSARQATSVTPPAVTQNPISKKTKKSRRKTKTSKAIPT